jgi:hypothetical protein
VSCEIVHVNVTWLLLKVCCELGNCLCKCYMITIVGLLCLVKFVCVNVTSKLLKLCEL